MGQVRERQRRLRRSRGDIRERLLDAALVEFGAKGFDGASTRAIAERIDAHQPQIHYHFESKEALWRAAVDHLFAELGRAMEGLDFGPDPARTTAVDTLADGFAELIRRFVRFAAARPELNRIMVHEATAKSERLRWMTDRHVRPLYETTTALFARLVEQGVLPDVPAPYLYYVLTGAGPTIFVLAPECRRLTGIDPLSPEAVQTHADIVVDLLFGRRGSRPR